MAEYQDNIAFVIFHCFIVFFFIILHVFGIIPFFFNEFGFFYQGSAR